ncbi:MAG: hypothetical protein GKR89_09880 [Candidatus Latescibacteria bacterium]|nr:hypothetical protein [Candidatus Latescibacterota bacterium]
MDRKLNVLFLPHPVSTLETPWDADVVEAVKTRHHLRIFDRSQPAAPQFEGIEAIVDLGGNIEGELVPIAARAGVKFLQVQTNGLDHVALDEIRAAGLILAHCPGQLSSVALAESAMMFILMMAHDYGRARQNFAAGHLYDPTGMELDGRLLVIVGFGASGQELARRAKPFGLRIAGIDIRPIEEEILDEIQPEFIGGPDDLDPLLGQCDFLSLHLHLTEANRHIIDARRLGLMQPSAALINVARGGLADEEALYAALLAGRLGAAGLDAFAAEPPDPRRPVYQLSNVYLTPHTAGSTDGTSRKRALFAADNLDRYARGEEVEARVL